MTSKNTHSLTSTPAASPRAQDLDSPHFTFSKNSSSECLIFQEDESQKQIEEEAKDEVNSELHMNFNKTTSDLLINRSHKKKK